jgi:polysaccharide export outer membrane protein
MKLFVHGLIVSGLIAAGLGFTGCSSTPASLAAIPAAGATPASSPALATSAPSAGVVQTNTAAILPTDAAATGMSQPNAEVARFHVGETVNIIFSGLPDATEFPPHEETIKEDGNINLPLIGSVQALGKTAGELQKEIQDLYVPKYYVRLTVTVKPGDLLYYVKGEVKTPGRQLYVGETTVTKAITSAGDFTDFASHKVTLIRANGERVKVNVDKALENPTLDVQVYPNDQVYVPRRIF